MTSPNQWSLKPILYPGCVLCGKRATVWLIDAIGAQRGALCPECGLRCRDERNRDLAAIARTHSTGAIDQAQSEAGDPPSEVPEPTER
jgi:hypothetical protein